MKKRFDLFEEPLEIVEIFGETALFADARVSAHELAVFFREIPLNMYYLRGSDDDPGIPATVEKNNVTVNFVGNLVSDVPLLQDNESYKEIGDLDLHFHGDIMFMDEYVKICLKKRGVECER